MSTRDIDNALRDLPLDQKIGALIVGLCEQSKDSIEAIKGLIATAAILGQNLPDQNDRRRCAMAIHDAAVDVEHEHVPLVKD